MDVDHLLNDLKTAFSKLNTEKEQLAIENKNLKSELKAVKTAFEKLKQLRERDKQTILAWQNKLEQTDVPESSPPQVVNEGVQEGVPETTDLSSDVYNLLETSQLYQRDWHPEDFILNPELKDIVEYDELADKQDTPAGFWDVDFPSSSQLAKQKQETKEQIKLEGRKRLSEALKGGRYLFKDPKYRRV